MASYFKLQRFYFNLTYKILKKGVPQKESLPLKITFHILSRPIADMVHESN